MTLTYTLKTVAEKVEAELIGDGDCPVTGVNTLTDASSEQISFLTNNKYKNQLQTTKAAAVIVTPQAQADVVGHALISKNPHATFAKVAQMFYQPPNVKSGIDPSARIAESAVIGKNVSIAANVVIGDRVTVGDDCVISANCVIQADTVLGYGCYLHPNITLYHSVSIGNGVTIHSHTTIGSDGFGFANDNGHWLTIPQFGSVSVGDKCSIGAGCTIDRGALGDTEIGFNVIIDNQVHIAHNCVIGDHSCICGATGMAGSVNIGKHVVIAGSCAINGHISICDNVQITGYSMVTSDITEPGVYSSGQPTMTNREWRKVSVRTRQLPELFDRVKKLERG